MTRPVMTWRGKAFIATLAAVCVVLIFHASHWSWWAGIIVGGVPAFVIAYLLAEYPD